jgi:hypothetical protein
MNHAQPSDYGDVSDRSAIDVVADWIFRNLAGDKDEYCSPPGSEIWVEFGEVDPGHGRPLYTATTYNNDGFELWIAYTKGPWLTHFRASDARRLAIIILWDWWIKSTWLGLKRALWYRSLRWICRRREEGQRRCFSK